MKKGDIFINPRTGNKCEVTRFYGNKSWYYKETNSNKEVRSTIDSSKIQIETGRRNLLEFFDTMAAIQDTMENYQPIPDGTKVKINIEELNKSKLNRTETFEKFVADNKDTIFTVKSTTPHIVSLEETVFTFWEHHLIIVDSIEK
jgi:hypothetical protein